MQVKASEIKAGDTIPGMGKVDAVQRKQGEVTAIIALTDYSWPENEQLYIERQKYDLHLKHANQGMAIVNTGKRYGDGTNNLYHVLRDLLHYANHVGEDFDLFLQEARKAHAEDMKPE